MAWKRQPCRYPCCFNALARAWETLGHQFGCALECSVSPPPNASLGHLMDKLIWHFSCTPRGIPALCWSSHPGLRKHPRWLWRPTWEQALHPEGYGASFPKHTRSILGNSSCTLVFTSRKDICLCSHVSARSSEDLVQRARTVQPHLRQSIGTSPRVVQAELHRGRKSDRSLHGSVKAAQEMRQHLPWMPWLPLGSAFLGHDALKPLLYHGRLSGSTLQVEVLPGMQLK